MGNPEIAEPVPPKAASMVESLRAYGYSLQTAIADIIDNSISARATRVWLEFVWREGESYIAILDDGIGMDQAELVEAMRPGTQSRSDKREPTDLGRFGLGLKTASFSQCRSCTVASKKNSTDICIRRWDLDFVSQTNTWNLLKNLRPGVEGVVDRLSNLAHGTAVVWQILDRILGQDNGLTSISRDRFWALTDEVERHLGMVFHRFLAGVSPRLKIYVNSNHSEESKEISAWDPFAINHPATDPSPVEHISGSCGTVTLQGSVLPHRDKLDDAAYELFGGPYGWFAQQGFYVYRNERLLVPGHWLGLGIGRTWVKEEHYKLARIRLDIPTSADFEWQIDVKKSTARPPSSMRPRLIQLASEIRRRAREVFVHRGAYGPRPRDESLTRLWIPQLDPARNRFKYRIDRGHPIVKAAIGTFGKRREVELLVRILEETVPVERIWLDVADGSKAPAQPFEGYDKPEIQDIMQQVFNRLLSSGTLTETQARETVSHMDAFRPYASLAERLTAKEN
ncbi:MAG TPA: ATP-binding protein [bacterium]|jgi:hypothetical protein